ncbi:MAG: hypothetical protein IJM20_01505 [Clostridia bacterium]|nr:hypothetical protein [Clostridia bacterium]
MEIKTVADRWTYILYGFRYIDEHNGADVPDTFGLARGELKAFILSAAAEDRARELCDALQLDCEPIPFESLPQSFEIMLKCDREYLDMEPETPLNAEFGSVAMAVLAGEIAEFSNAASPLQSAMLERISEVTEREPILP